jgi:ribosomal protein S18 acetylase RimI-like enzyme
VVGDPALIPATATFRMLFWSAARLRDYLVALPVAPNAVTILQQPIGDGHGDPPCDWSVFIGAEHPCVATTPGDHPPCPDGLHYDEADITRSVTELLIASGGRGARTYRLSAYAHGQVLGWVKYQHHPDRVLIDFIEVNWDRRRQGVATRLLDELQRRRAGLPLTTGGFTAEGEKLAAAYPTSILEEYDWRQRHSQA